MNIIYFILTLFDQITILILFY